MRNRFLLTTSFMLMLSSISAAAPVRYSVASDTPSEITAILSDSLNIPTLAPKLDREELDRALLVERERLEEIVRAFGYLDGSVVITDVEGPTTGKSLRNVIFNVSAGPLYRIGLIEISGAMALKPAETLEIQTYIASKAGQPARGDVITEIQHVVHGILRRHAHPFPQFTAVTLTPDRATMTADLSLNLNPGEPLVFGSVGFKGNVLIRSTDLAAAVSIRSGEPFNSDELDRFRTTLTNMPTIKAFGVNLEDNGAGKVDITVGLKERPGEELLANGWLPGVWTCLAGLGALFLRQVGVAAGIWRTPRLLLTIDGITVLLVSMGLLYMLPRTLAFLGL